MRVRCFALGALLAGCGGANPAPTTPSSPSAPTATQVEPLKGAASATSRLVGAAVKTSLLSDPTYAGTFAHHFNFVTAEFEMRKLGTGYIAEAFRLARAADPDALLIYNDYGAEGMNRKSEDVYNLVRDLLAQGAPIGGVGLQMHLDASSRPATADIARNIRRLAALGLLVNISEMDVRVARVSGDMTAKLEEQRRVYHDVLAVCVAEPRCHAVTFWGFTDRHSWIDAFFGADDPLLFDDAYRPKPSYFGTLDALHGR